MLIIFTSGGGRHRGRAGEFGTSPSRGWFPGRPANERCHQRPRGHRAGRPESRGPALPLRFDRLRPVGAAAVARELPGQSLQPAALVHEACSWLALSNRAWDGRGHFFAAAARAIRRILVGHAHRRRRHRLKRGGRHVRIDLDDAQPAVANTDDLLALDEALRLAAQALGGTNTARPASRLRRLTLAEAMRILGLSKSTADRLLGVCTSMAPRLRSPGEKPAPSRNPRNNDPKKNNDPRQDDTVAGPSHSLGFVGGLVSQSI